MTDSSAQPLVRVEERVPANQAAEFRAIIGPIAERMREQVQAGANPAAALTRAELATLVGSTVNELQQVENGPDRVQRGVGGEDWASDVLQCAGGSAAERQGCDLTAKVRILGYPSD